MKRLLFRVSLITALVVGVPAIGGATTISLDFSSNVGGAVSFGGGNFTFDGGFHNTDANIDGVTENSLIGLFGSIQGTFAIGPITTDAGLSTASVTGQGQLSISDGVDTFSADLQWVDISQQGSGGGLNAINGEVNLSNFAYTGSNTGLLALLTSGSGAVTATFQFDPAETLSALKAVPAARPHSTSYSGSLYSVPDGGTTLWLLGGALLGLGFLQRRLNG